MTKILLKGAREIGEAIGVNRNEIPKLVCSEGLPAWKEAESSPWKALPEDLQAWLRKRRSQHLGLEAVLDLRKGSD